MLRRERFFAGVVRDDRPYNNWVEVSVWLIGSRGFRHWIAMKARHYHDSGGRSGVGGRNPDPALAGVLEVASMDDHRRRC
jgi:hypothetical protein